MQAQSEHPEMPESRDTALLPAFANVCNSRVPYRPKPAAWPALGVGFAGVICVSVVFKIRIFSGPKNADEKDEPGTRWEVFSSRCNSLSDTDASIDALRWIPATDPISA